MIIVAGSVTIRPEKRAEAVAHAAQMTQATEAEPGCLAYRFYSDISDDNTFLIFEQWETAEALERHLQRPHTAAFSARLPEWLAAPPDVRRYDVARVERIM